MFRKILIMNKNKILVLITIIASLFFSGCAGVDLSNVDLSNVSEEDINKFIVCEKPYIRHATACCLDQNENKICDQDENSQIQSNLNIYGEDRYNENNYQSPIEHYEDVKFIESDIMEKVEKFELGAFEGKCYREESGSNYYTKECEFDEDRKSVV